MKLNKETADFLEINEDDLVIECRDQPKIYFDYAFDHARAKRQLEEAKQELKVVEAEVEMAIREDCGAYGIGKLTEASVKAAIPLQPEYKSAYKEVTKMKYYVDIFGAAVEALQHRKQSLENLVFLHGQGYFAAPRIPNTGMREDIDFQRKKDQRSKSIKKRRREEN